LTSRFFQDKNSLSLSEFLSCILIATNKTEIKQLKVVFVFMVAEIIDDELHLKARQAKWRKVRFVFYLLAYSVFFVPHSLPIPFAPEILHDIFGAKNGALITAFVFLLFIFSIFILAIRFLWELSAHLRFNKTLLLEIFSVPLMFIVIGYLSGIFFSQTPQKIVSINEELPPEQFQNPFLGYKMLDCRNITDEFDVVFIPQHLMIETDYLAYAPRRQKKTIDYKYGKKFGEDWYWEFSGSQWSNDLRNCFFQYKSPNN
jgi:hypothetical protein